MTHYDNAIHVMEKQGGAFVQSLAHCYLMADPVNKAKLRETFAGYFEVYERRFEQWKDQQLEHV
jgi:hypothetical protein